MNRILAIDDDRDILKVLKANLELQSYEVDTADNWETAQGIISKKQPDLILLDLTLPDGDGVEICRELKNDLPRIPIIMLTARSQEKDIELGEETGADEYVAKPFDMEALTELVMKYLNKQS